MREDVPAEPALAEMSKQYVETLILEAKARYLQKISIIGSIDPLSLGRPTSEK